MIAGMGTNRASGAILYGCCPLYTREGAPPFSRRKQRLDSHHRSGLVRSLWLRFLVVWGEQGVKRSQRVDRRSEDVWSVGYVDVSKIV